jgi:hypothetical protein
VEKEKPKTRAPPWEASEEAKPQGRGKPPGWETPPALKKAQGR